MSTESSTDRRGIRGRMDAFRRNVEGLQEQMNLSPIFAQRCWKATRSGIEADHVLNAAEKLELITLGDKITDDTPLPAEAPKKASGPRA